MRVRWCRGGKSGPLGQIGRTEDRPMARLHGEVAKLCTVMRPRVILGDAPAWRSVSHPTRQWFLDEAFVLASSSLRQVWQAHWDQLRPVLMTRRPGPGALAMVASRPCALMLINCKFSLN